MTISPRRFLFSTGIFIVLTLTSLVYVTQLLSAFWRNMGAIGITQSLTQANGTSVIESLVRSNQDQFVNENQMAVSFLRKAIRLNPDASHNYYLLYIAYWNFGVLDRGVYHPDKLECPNCDDNIFLVFLAGASLYRQGNPVAAWQTWKRAPDLDVFFSELGFRFLASGERPKAYEFWRGAEMINSTPKPAKARMYKYMCERSFRFQEWSEAEQWCRKWQWAQPSPRADLMVAHALIGNGDIDAAVRLSEKLHGTTDVPESLETQLLWLDGRIAAAREDWCQAFQNFDLALANMSDNPSLYLHYASALLSAGRMETAREMLNKAEQFDNGTLAPLIAQLRERVD